MDAGGGSQEIDVAEFALKMPRFAWKMLATSDSLRASGRTKTAHDRSTRRTWRFDFPSAFHTYSLYERAVDDNNRTRQERLNLATAWTSKNFANRHFLMCFAVAESNALHMWNHTHPENKHSKVSWRLKLIPELLAMGRNQRSQAPPMRNDQCEQRNQTSPMRNDQCEQRIQTSPTRNDQCELRTIAMHTKWSARRNQFVPAEPRRVCSDVASPVTTCTFRSFFYLYKHLMLNAGATPMRRTKT